MQGEATGLKRATLSLHGACEKRNCKDVRVATSGEVERDGSPLDRAL